jgi:hypothetical protein
MKSLLKTCSIIIKRLDYFGVQMTFQYKDKIKYRSLFGGLVFTLFFIFAVIYAIINFNTFINRNTMNLVYNEGYKEIADEINFQDYELGFGVGLDIGSPEITPILYKYLNISVNEVTLLKQVGKTSKNKKNLNMKICAYEDFYNKVNNSFDILGLKNYYCPELFNSSLKGMWSEDIFRYYEVIVSLNQDYYNNVTEAQILFSLYEIKINIYYLENSIWVYDYEKPVQKFINNWFTVLDWRFIKKANMDFMKFNFISDSNILFREDISQEYLVLGSTTEYFNDLGENRFTTRPRDFNVFNKVYFRSSPNFRLIKRVYMKITEYLANMSSILSTILLVLYVIVTRLNIFKAQQSVLKKILRFKENLSEKQRDSYVYMKEKFIHDSKLNHLN